MRTTINGREHELDDLAADESAVHVLRERCGLKGTKVACGAGVCGACTVLVNGTPMVSCLLPAHHLDDREVQTIEAFGRDNLHPIQKAFMVHDGLQCGFCTPGFITESIAFFDRWRAERGRTTPAAEEVAAALAGHLCRCGSYKGIYEAVQQACAGAYDDVDLADLTPARVDALEKVTGAAIYTVDVQHEGQLEGLIFRSPHPHARVKKIDTKAALAIEGVVGVADLMEGKSTVRYLGQPIAAVAAVNGQIAKQALDAIEVDFDILPSIIEPAVARDSSSSPIYDKESQADAPILAEGFLLPGVWENNIRRARLKITSRRPGRARKEISNARQANDANLVEHTYRNEPQTQSALEPHACVARWDGPTRLSVHTSSQNVHGLKAEIAEHFDLQDEQVFVDAAYVGGGFGSKHGPYEEVVAAITLARVTNQPVRVAASRLEELSYTGYRPGGETEFALLTDKNGQLQAVTADAYSEGGVAIGATTSALMGFTLPSVARDLSDYDVVTNTSAGKPFRGPHGPLSLWAVEQAIDEAAYKHNRDPLELRRSWFRDHEIRQKLYDWAESIPAWRDKGPVGGDKGRFRRGIGVAASAWIMLFNPNAQVEVRSTRDGLVVCSATQDVGNGARTVLAQAAADVFELPLREITVEAGTSDGPRGPAAGGSQATTSIYYPAFKAAEKVRDYLLEQASTILKLGNVSAAAGGIKHDAGFMSWSELMANSAPFTVTEQRGATRGPLGLPFKLPGNPDAASPGTRLSHALTVTQLEVDTRLGKIRPLHVWSGVAAGKIFVPDLARSQVYGAIIQGLGYALYEQKQLDRRTGHNLTGNMEDYKIPGIGDMPDMDVYFYEKGFEEIKGRGIGLSELATVGLAASVGNAVYHATGWRPLQTPIRPQDVIEGVRA